MVMLKYKTVVTDYEGMQGVLDTHSAQGWRLFSLSPDTWRKSITSANDTTSPFDELASTPGATAFEYSASYYLLVFHRDDFADSLERAASAEESHPFNPMHYFEG
jgi:hypothetical protein